MTSPVPLSIYHPMCSYCWKLSENPIFFVLENGAMHWACCEKHKELIKEKKKEIPLEELNKKLCKMYLEMWKDTKYGKRVLSRERKPKKRHTISDNIITHLNTLSQKG